MMKLTAIAMCIAATLAAPINSPAHEDMFSEWTTKYAKSYTSVEERAERFAVFVANAIKVEAHNAGNHGWTMHLNEFADLTEQEFGARMGLLSGRQSSQNLHEAVGAGDEPTSVDWRTEKLVTDVKNQGSCGSCWAFSTVVSLEGQQAKKNGKLVSLSEQNLVDCVKNVKLPNDTQACCDGCQGGLMDYAFKYMIDSQKGGDDTESSYPYKGVSGSCSFKSDDVGVTIKSYTDIKVGDEVSLKNAVATVGPISVGVDANFGWQLYHGGVFTPTPVIGCSSDPSKMDHGVAVVGYGTDSGKDYWIIKNSWGATWGEEGYLRLIANKNACGVANAAVYPNL